ncbi:MAG: hypothetical protein ACR2NZ_01080 [Rubripirellula sp.]
MQIPRHRAFALLNLCVGDEIWNVETCRQSGVPEAWIAELSDAFESGYQSDHQTIYVDDAPTNQYHGVRDLDIAIKVAEALGVNAERATSSAMHRRAMVQAIKTAVFDGE